MPPDDEVLSHPDQLTPAWLGRALFGDADAVVAIEPAGQGGETGTWSRVTRFRAHYRVTTDLPERLLLKICADEAGSFGRSELDYYCRDYLGVPDAPLVRCLSGAYAEQPQRCYHLLLEDLSETHVNGFERQPPDLPQALALAEALAALHAPHWGRVTISDEAIAGHSAHILPGLAPLLERVGPDPQLAALIEGMAARLIERARDPRGMTLIHGDLNPGNLLVPRSGPGSLLLIDRQPFDWSLTVWLGASDLVNATVCWWDEDARRALEAPMLARYHEGLLRRGVRDYSFERLLADYRASLLLALATPVEWCVLETDRERMRWLWTQQLRRARAACEDHGLIALNRA